MHLEGLPSNDVKRVISNDEDDNTCSIHNWKRNLKDYLHQESPAKKFRGLLQFWGGGGEKWAIYSWPIHAMSPICF